MLMASTIWLLFLVVAFSLSLDILGDFRDLYLLMLFMSNVKT